MPHVFAPLGNETFLQSLAIPKDHIHCLDWWESLRLDINDSPALDLTCTPSQHNSGRGAFDHFKTLWGSWVVSQPENGHKVFFAGDTGYRSVVAGQSEDDVPVCPAFREIGERFGSIDLALLPIG
jgi:N-acyl-phosphatidylethanolamine-hydrolysing phospholipase D